MNGTRDDDGERSCPVATRVVDSGAVGDSVHLTGTIVAGRDVHFHESDAERADRYLYQLTPDIADFTGRDDQLAQLRSLLRRRGGRRRTSLVISAIAGKAGVGKTALPPGWPTSSGTASPTASCT